jgi:hypothetical protein
MVSFSRRTLVHGLSVELGVKRSVMLDIGLKEVVPKIAEVSDIQK